ncbi:hypothetical protein [Burkholderia seminalis]|uniref:hypothetical protein n=1 Tax=Burkholderia seminalis TaxID=488731 RepID=UPI00158440C2|nr:hypothetical protein [Burkholderia seminalis]MCA8430015.1 hypothetical protein [Burkholderia seminalis]
MNDDTWFRVVSVTYFAAASLSILAGVAQYRVSNRISDKKDAELAQYKVEAEAKIADANKKAALANQEAANAIREAAVANKAAAELNEKAIVLEAENLRVKKQLEWRAIDSEQRQNIIKKFRARPGVEVELGSVMGDAEGLSYASQFADAIISSGWSLPDGGAKQMAFGGSAPVGVQVWANQADEDNPKIRGILDLIVSTLFDGKIIPERRVEGRPDVQQGKVLIMIGVKPPLKVPR